MSTLDPKEVLIAALVTTQLEAHDLLHMRQLVELHRALTVLKADPYCVDYAGPE